MVNPIPDVGADEFMKGSGENGSRNNRLGSFFVGIHGRQRIEPVTTTGISSLPYLI
ncbi:MAG: hypothetical protein JRH03_07075 [Deltaproteobacteria bacterium]|nr:hypothetical protein [Deltaproteobacteria bacterium]